MTPTRTFFFLATLATAMLLATTTAGCRSKAGVPVAGTFVGHVDGTEAFVAVARAGKTVVAYVCDGVGTATWFRGAARGRTLDLSSGKARLQATITEAGVTGTFAPEEGPARAFAAQPAAGGAGFYRASRTVAGLSYVGGWIVLSSGAQRGAVKQNGTVLADGPIRLDPNDPVVVLPDGGTLTARPVADFLTEAAPTPPGPAR